MKVLPAGLRDALAAGGWTVHALETVTVRESADGTKKLALRCADGATIETVLLDMDNDTCTQCLSSQAGCPLKCAFCMTGTLGLTRNLTAAEIVDQHLLALSLVPEGKIRNLVFMGMGEPLLNFDNVAEAIRVLQEERGRAISPRRITVSTAGVVPGIERLGKEVDCLLAVSLNAPTQELRTQIMPISRKYPLDQLMAALKAYPLKPRQRITFEYVLLGGVNDSPAHARELVRLLSHIRCKVNLIPFNPFPGSALTRPTDQAVAAFLDVLASKNFTATVRKSKGQDIEAACGQLAGLGLETVSPTQRK